MNTRIQKMLEGIADNKKTPREKMLEAMEHLDSAYAVLHGCECADILDTLENVSVELSHLIGEQ